MAKAALNMMTRTSSGEMFETDRILMTAVDTGWITDERPHHEKLPGSQRRGGTRRSTSSTGPRGSTTRSCSVRAAPTCSAASSRTTSRHPGDLKDSPHEQLESAEDFHARVAAATDDEGRLPVAIELMPGWDIFPFELDGLRIKPLEPLSRPRGLRAMVRTRPTARASSRRTPSERLDSCGATSGGCWSTAA